MKKILFANIILAIAIPTLTFAISLGVKNDTTFGQVLGYVNEMVNILIPILETVAFIVFFWGLSKFILNSNKPAEIENGKKYMMWGILALFILLSYTAIIGIIKGELFGNSDTDPNSVLLPTGASVKTGTAIQLPDGTFKIINE